MYKSPAYMDLRNIHAGVDHVLRNVAQSHRNAFNDRAGQVLLVVVTAQSVEYARGIAVPDGRAFSESVGKKYNAPRTLRAVTQRSQQMLIIVCGFQFFFPGSFRRTTSIQCLRCW